MSAVAVFPDAPFLIQRPEWRHRKGLVLCTSGSGAGLGYEILWDDFSQEAWHSAYIIPSTLGR